MTHKFHLPINFNMHVFREGIAFALQEFCNLWFKREFAKSNALKSLKLKIYIILLIVEFHFIAVIYYLLEEKSPSTP